jgi:Methyltransferase domain
MPDPQVSQFYPEYLTWLSLCKAFGVRTYLELGTERGAAAKMAHRFLMMAKVVTVDLSHRSLAHFDSEITYLEANSHGEHTPEAVLAILGKDLIDAVFVDGDHSYQGVKADCEMWWPKTRLLMGFHDINTHSCPDVGRYWNEIAVKHRSVAIQIPRAQTIDSNCGIGVLFRRDLIPTEPEDLYAYAGGKYAV